MSLVSNPDSAWDVCNVKHNFLHDRWDQTYGKRRVALNTLKSFDRVCDMSKYSLTTDCFRFHELLSPVSNENCGEACFIWYWVTASCHRTPIPNDLDRFSPREAREC